MEKIRVGFIGLGARGMVMLSPTVKLFDNVDVVGICDTRQDRIDRAKKLIEEVRGTTPFCTTDYREILSMDLDAVMILSAWEAHVEIAVAAMKAGIRTGLEVGGAYSIEDCYRLVRAHEETGTHSMLLENCCYGKRELAVLKMVREGIMGEIVHCAGGYCHNLCSEVTYDGLNKGHYRLRNYTSRNCENYPTHEIGPIAKILNINNGNRFVSLTSTASKAVGIKTYVQEHIEDLKVLENVDFKQGDVVTTVIKCANGETVTITLDTCLPRNYSRMFTVRGTKGSYFEDMASFYIEADHGTEHEWDAKALLNNEDEYLDKYKPDIWKKCEEVAVKTGHGGMDYMVLAAFFESIEKNVAPPIDVYDAATWMAITALSEESILKGSAPVVFPDFTTGKWMIKKQPQTDLEFNLD